MEFVEPNSPRWLSLDDLPNERWKDIAGYEGLYQISDYGRVKSLARKTNNQYGIEQIMKITPNKKSGYSCLHFSVNGVHCRCLVHILVAKAFVPNPNHKPFVLHKKAVSDGGSNHYSNLYWGTQKENMRDRKNENKYTVSPEQIDNIITRQSKPINQYDLMGNYIKTWNSSVEASRCLNIDPSSILKVCKKHKKSAGGYLWETYVGKINNIQPYLKIKRVYKKPCKPVLQLNKDSSVVKIWDSVKQVNQTLGISEHSIYRVCEKTRKSTGGYKWKYYEDGEI